LNEGSYDVGMPRYVVLLHKTPVHYARGTHFDLMLENEGVLLTWGVPELPRTDAAVAGERLPDHRLVYLDYEGLVAGDRGSVQRVEGGEFEWIEMTPTRFQAQVVGKKMRGRLVIEQDAKEPQRWRVALSD
jgi:hypothetical protein